MYKSFPFNAKKAGLLSPLTTSVTLGVVDPVVISILETLPAVACAKCKSLPFNNRPEGSLNPINYQY
ncbi:hypothetical protein APS56_05685 [Pseudalgibacter alginicilyticus]|uniref:Uncharacterized protein n=1 Tax=Pseudalgibacter alginicilyticus TaxID=1736674 RepID=A0A0N7HY98_9FLAO|nr:hypothetical protein [Pseudalgibacter alginicilyticus]ALJ04654.1 hypothetical protein APS56_05685 [Pseudalgibacter alginicilyticus]